MSEPTTKDGAVFKIGMRIVNDKGVQFETSDCELQFAHGHWAIFGRGREQGFKLAAYYSTPASRFADKLREARQMREFWTAEEAKFEEFVRASSSPVGEEAGQ